MPDASPLIQPADVLLGILSGTLAGQRWILTFHYCVDDDADEIPLEKYTDPFKIATWDVGALPGIKSLMSHESRLDTVTVQRVWPVRSIAWPFDFSGEDGDVGTGSLPPTNAAVMRRKGLTANRHNLGRIYIPGIPAANVVAGKITAGALPDFNDTKVVLATALDVADGSNHATARAVLCAQNAPQTHVDIVVTQVDPVLRVQRRREVGRGI